MKKYLIVFLIFWLGTIHFLAYENPRVQMLVNYFNSKNQSQDLGPSVEDDYELILKFLDVYYPLNENSNTKQIFSSVEKLVDPSVRAKILEGYKENLDFLMGKKSTRSYNLEKILKMKKDGNYIVYLNMKKSLNGSKDFPYVFKVTFDIKNDNLINSGSPQIHDFKEVVITEPTEELINKDLFVENGVVTDSDFPCETNILSPVNSKSEIEYKVLPREKGIF